MGRGEGIVGGGKGWGGWEMLQSPEFYFKAEAELNQRLPPGGQPDKSYMGISRDKKMNSEVHKYD